MGGNADPGRDDVAPKDVEAGIADATEAGAEDVGSKRVWDELVGAGRRGKSSSTWSRVVVDEVGNPASEGERPEAGAEAPIGVFGDGTRGAGVRKIFALGEVGDSS